MGPYITGSSTETNIHWQRLTESTFLELWNLMWNSQEHREYLMKNRVAEIQWKSSGLSHLHTMPQFPSAAAVAMGTATCPCQLADDRGLMQTCHFLNHGGAFWSTWKWVTDWAEVSGWAIRVDAEACEDDGRLRVEETAYPLFMKEGKGQQEWERARNNRAGCLVIESWSGCGIGKWGDDQPISDSCGRGLFNWRGWCCQKTNLSVKTSKGNIHQTEEKWSTWKQEGKGQSMPLAFPEQSQLWGREELVNENGAPWWGWRCFLMFAWICTDISNLIHITLFLFHKIQRFLFRLIQFSRNSGARSWWPSWESNVDIWIWVWITGNAYSSF